MQDYKDKNDELTKLVAKKGLHDRARLQEELLEYKAMLEARDAQIAKLEKMLELSEKANSRAQHQQYRSEHSAHEEVATLRSTLEYYKGKLGEKERIIEMFHLRSHKGDGTPANRRPPLGQNAGSRDSRGMQRARSESTSALNTSTTPAVRESPSPSKTPVPSSSYLSPSPVPASVSIFANSPVARISPMPRQHSDPTAKGFGTGQAGALDVGRLEREAAELAEALRAAREQVKQEERNLAQRDEDGLRAKAQHQHQEEMLRQARIQEEDEAQARLRRLREEENRLRKMREEEERAMADQRAREEKEALRRIEEERLMRQREDEERMRKLREEEEARLLAEREAKERQESQKKEEEQRLLEQEIARAAIEKAKEERRKKDALLAKVSLPKKRVGKAVIEIEDHNHITTVWG